MKNGGKIQLGNSFFDYHGHDLTQGAGTAFASKAAFTLAMLFAKMSALVSVHMCLCVMATFGNVILV
jgi:hypothetical protein